MAHPRPSRLLGTVVVLGLALVVTAMLVYQAEVAARGHRLTAERTLHDYASFAAWQLEQQVKNELLTAMIPSLAQAAMRVDPAHLPQSLLSPTAVEALAHADAGWCKCLDSVRYYFRLDWPNGALLTTRTNASSGELRWARDTIVAAVRQMEPLKDMLPRAYGSSDLNPRPQSVMRVILTNDSYVMILGGLDDQPRLLVFLVSRNLNGQPVVIYGYETPPLAYLSPAFMAIYRRATLLPPSLVGSMPLDSVLSIAVEDSRGFPIFG
ncbi:MAG TPA: hypothetical protein VIJ16_06590, partial [Gemmatimonadaceae bacterium]